MIAGATCAEVDLTPRIENKNVKANANIFFPGKFCTVLSLGRLNKNSLASGTNLQGDSIYMLFYIRHFLKSLSSPSLYCLDLRIAHLFSIESELKWLVQVQASAAVEDELPTAMAGRLWTTLGSAWYPGRSCRAK